MKILSAKNPLWQYLDDLGAEFRSPKSYLIDEFGASPCGWIDDFNVCELLTETPFIEGLARPLSFNFSSKRDQSAPPILLNAYVRSSHDAEKNFRDAVEKLEAVFGVGADNSVSNTVSRVWSFEKGSLVATIFPPHLNPGPNSRHEKISGSATECSIQIMPGYSPSISYRVLSALETAPVFWKVPKEALPNRFNGTRAETELYVPQAHGPAIGTLKIGTSSDVLFFSTTAETVHVLDLKWIESVRYFKVLPARGAGGIILTIPYRPQGRRDVPENHLNVIDVPFVEGAYLDLARALAGALSVELKQYEHDDV